MAHLRRLEEANLAADSFVTIGVFDGVHLGHQRLIRGLADGARARSCKSVAVTFHPHPDKVLRDVPQRYYLTTADERADLLKRLGIDLVITLPFDAAFRQLRAAEFVERLARHLRMRALWVGSGFALGYQREGDVPFLRAQGQRHGFTVKAIKLVTTDANDGLIGSSGTRAALQHGEVAAAAAMLGRDYSLAGKVVKGAQRGRSIGAPTANVEVWREQIVPGNGVYACWAQLGEERFMAATNIGIRPTFAGDAITVEAHLLDFDRDIYGERLELRFVKRLREERKFAGLPDLVEQIGRDIERTRIILSGQSP